MKKNFRAFTLSASIVNLFLSFLEIIGAILLLISTQTQTGLIVVATIVGLIIAILMLICSMVTSAQYETDLSKYSVGTSMFLFVLNCFTSIVILGLTAIMPSVIILCLILAHAMCATFLMIDISRIKNQRIINNIEPSSKNRIYDYPSKSNKNDKEVQSTELSQYMNSVEKDNAKDDNMEQIMKLSELKNQGIISETEFTKLKNRIINKK